MNTMELTLAVTALANAIANELTDNEIALLASISVQLGDTLATLLTHRALCEATDAE